MKRMLLLAGLLALALVPAQANLPESGSLAPQSKATFKLKFGDTTPKNMTPRVRVAPTCVTPAGICWVPGFGACYCCFWNGCFNGWSS